MLPPFMISSRTSLLAASLTALLVACSPGPKAHEASAKGTWARWNAYGDEISYLNTRYVSAGPPIVADTLNVWRPEPAFTYQIKTRRAFWCDEQQVALLRRWVSKNGGRFQEREISEDRGRRSSIREYDVHSNTLAAPPNQIANLHRIVCNRQFGDTVADPMADFESITSAGRHR